MPYPQVACSRTRRTKNNTPLVERGKLWLGRVVESCLLCWFRIVRNSGQALSRILAFAVVGVAASCSDFVRPPSCILCTFMNALWALRPCKAFGRSFYKASVPYPQVAGSPTHQHIKSVTPLNEWGYTFWCRWRGSNPHGIATNGF